jgi:hypothetical protein
MSEPVVALRHHRLGIVTGRAVYEAGTALEQVPGAALVLLCWLRLCLPGTAGRRVVEGLEELGVLYSWQLAWEYLELDFQCGVDDLDDVLACLPRRTGSDDGPDGAALGEAAAHAFDLHRDWCASGARWSATRIARMLGQPDLDRYGLGRDEPPYRVDEAALAHVWRAVQSPQLIVLAGDVDTVPATAAIAPTSAPRPLPLPVARQDCRVHVSLALDATDRWAAAVVAVALDTAMAGRFRRDAGLAYDVVAEPRGSWVMARVSGEDRLRDRLIDGMHAAALEVRRMNGDEWRRAATVALGQALIARQRSEHVADRLLELATSAASPVDALERELVALRTAVDGRPPTTLDSVRGCLLATRTDGTADEFALPA